MKGKTIKKKVYFCDAKLEEKLFHERREVETRWILWATRGRRRRSSQLSPINMLNIIVVEIAIESSCLVIEHY